MTDTRLTLRQAAAALGVSESAIRKRVERGTLRSDKGADGRRYVYVDTVADTVADEVADVSSTREHDALISRLSAENEYLRDTIATRDQEIARRDTIIMNMSEAMKALSPPAQEAPSEASQSPDTGDQQQGRGTARGEPQEGVQRPWWRKLIGR